MPDPISSTSTATKTRSRSRTAVSIAAVAVVALGIGGFIYLNVVTPGGFNLSQLGIGDQTFDIEIDSEDMFSEFDTNMDITENGALVNTESDPAADGLNQNASNPGQPVVFDKVNFCGDARQAASLSIRYNDLPIEDAMADGEPLEIVVPFGEEIRPFDRYGNDLLQTRQFSVTAIDAEGQKIISSLAYTGQSTHPQSAVLYQDLSKSAVGDEEAGKFVVQPISPSGAYPVNLHFSACGLSESIPISVRYETALLDWEEDLAQRPTFPCGVNECRLGYNTGDAGVLSSFLTFNQDNYLDTRFLSSSAKSTVLTEDYPEDRQINSVKTVMTVVPEMVGPNETLRGDIHLCLSHNEGDTWNCQGIVEGQREDARTVSHLFNFNNKPGNRLMYGFRVIQDDNFSRLGVAANVDGSTLLAKTTSLTSQKDGYSIEQVKFASSATKSALAKDYADSLKAYREKLVQTLDQENEDVAITIQNLEIAEKNLKDYGSIAFSDAEGISVGFSDLPDSVNTTLKDNDVVKGIDETLTVKEDNLKSATSTLTNISLEDIQSATLFTPEETKRLDPQLKQLRLASSALGVATYSALEKDEVTITNLETLDPELTLTGTALAPVVSTMPLLSDAAYKTFAVSETIASSKDGVSEGVITSLNDIQDASKDVMVANADMRVYFPADGFRLQIEDTPKTLNVVSLETLRLGETAETAQPFSIEGVDVYTPPSTGDVSVSTTIGNELDGIGYEAVSISDTGNTITDINSNTTYTIDYGPLTTSSVFTGEFEAIEDVSSRVLTPADGYTYEFASDFVNTLATSDSFTPTINSALDSATANAITYEIESTQVVDGAEYINVSTTLTDFVAGLEDTQDAIEDLEASDAITASIGLEPLTGAQSISSSDNLRGFARLVSSRTTTHDDRFQPSDASLGHMAATIVDLNERGQDYGFVYASPTHDVYNPADEGGGSWIWFAGDPRMTVQPTRHDEPDAWGSLLFSLPGGEDIERFGPTTKVTFDDEIPSGQYWLDIQVSPPFGADGVSSAPIRLVTLPEQRAGIESLQFNVATSEKINVPVEPDPEPETCEETRARMIQEGQPERKLPVCDGDGPVVVDDPAEPTCEEKREQQIKDGIDPSEALTCDSDEPEEEKLTCEEDRQKKLEAGTPPNEIPLCTPVDDPEIIEDTNDDLLVSYSIEHRDYHRTIVGVTLGGDYENYCKDNSGDITFSWGEDGGELSSTSVVHYDARNRDDQKCYAIMRGLKGGLPEGTNEGNVSNGRGQYDFRLALDGRETKKHDVKTLNRTMAVMYYHCLVYGEMCKLYTKNESLDDLASIDNVPRLEGVRWWVDPQSINPDVEPVHPSGMKFAMATDPRFDEFSSRLFHSCEGESSKECIRDAYRPVFDRLLEDCISCFDDDGGVEFWRQQVEDIPEVHRINKNGFVYAAFISDEGKENYLNLAGSGSERSEALGSFAYLRALRRAADAGGVQNIVAQEFGQHGGDDADLDAAIRSLAQSDEKKNNLAAIEQQYSSETDACAGRRAAVTEIYQSCFGRASDVEGVDYWACTQTDTPILDLNTQFCAEGEK